ncbi:MAG TPA: hypothetical protein VGD22_07065 [Sphingobacteriaceae bacterium]
MNPSFNDFFKEYDVIINACATISIGVVALIISFLYSHKSEKLSNDQIFYDLYTNFNSRYDKLNDILGRMEMQKDFDLVKLKADPIYYKTAIDFFNICAEEYYWHEKDRIEKNVWTAWEYGMNYWYINIPALRALWKEEIKDQRYKSYYLKEGNNLFKEVS